MKLIFNYSVIFVSSRYAPCGKAAKVTSDQAVFLPFLLETRGKGPFFTFTVVRRLSRSSEKIKKKRLSAAAGIVADHMTKMNCGNGKSRNS